MLFKCNVKQRLSLLVSPISCSEASFTLAAATCTEMEPEVGGFRSASLKPRGIYSPAEALGLKSAAAPLCSCL